MAGSFDIFRQNQRAALAALAILAMLAFFVLPPILQMGQGIGMADPVAVSWQGGELHESGLMRAVTARKVMNQFLAEAYAAAGQDPSRLSMVADEKQVFDDLLLAREAEANGVVVSNDAINDFLADWTLNAVSADQFKEILGRLGGRVGVSRREVFESLRTVLMARRMEMLLASGVRFESTPPGWRWDYFRRLEQSATAEVVPVVVEKYVDEVRAPSDADLRSLFERHKDELPAARSPTPGFREPHRIGYEFLAAKPDAFIDEAKQAVTDEQIAAFYEERKAALYRAKPAATDAPAPGSAAKPESEAKPDAATESGTPDGERKEADKADTKDAEEAARKDGAAAPRRTPVQTVAFRQPAPPAEGAAPATDAPQGNDGQKDGATKQDETKQDETKQDDTKEEAKVEFEPLEKVKDDIRQRLAREAVEKRINGAFEKVQAAVLRYAEDLALWEVSKGSPGSIAPKQLDIKAIAAENSLEAGSSGLVNESEAVAAGGIGSSFEIVMSPQFGVRQQNWVSMLFAPAVQVRQPVTSRGVDGTRYLSWKTEDQPEFTPSFETARKDVERAWRIMEARPLARKRAEELAREAGAGDKPLAEVAKDRDGLEAIAIGPFSWLTRGTAPFGSQPVLSQPDGVAMPGEEFMQAMFALEPGRSGVAFNEPQTVCYCIRLSAFDPDDAVLKERFVAASSDPRRLAAVAGQDMRDVFVRWMQELETRKRVSWKRPPRLGD